MLLNWIVAVILAYTNVWAPRECDPEDIRCMTANEEKAEDLNTLAQSILDESTRQNLDTLMVTAVIARESSFVREPCGRQLLLDQVISWESDGLASDSYALKWKCPHSAWAPECEKRVWDAHEEGRYLIYSTCSADEVGFMQIVPWTPWALAGAIIPGTERVIENGRLFGDKGERAVDMHGGPVGGWTLPEGETSVLQLTLPDDNDRGDDPEIWSTIILSAEPVDGGGAVDDGAMLTLQQPLPADLDEFTNFVMARGLPQSHRERRELMLQTPINVAVGCGELAMDHRQFFRESHPGWWDWVGTYNAGSRGTIATAYAGRILDTYVQMCETIISTDDQGNETRLKDVWDGCAQAAEANDRR